MESFGEEAFVLLLRGPEAIFHRLNDVVMVPRLDHEVSNTCIAGVLGGCCLTVVRRSRRLRRM